ncbi:hypothetical protein BLNAU_7866 [Blattamonas nauphoetae]|uniref:Uncharacterized protein n=1 Tax=Blattamonas nauphoetae TaxID=2049346 RepID=A0ABQ9XZY3_9EUKA|nr:hypothetical protein BLNAU_7866 [Blattamonas nauphoetae]
MKPVLSGRMKQNIVGLCQPNYKMPGKGNIVGLWNGFTPLTLHKPSCSPSSTNNTRRTIASVETTKHPILPSFISRPQVPSRSIDTSLRLPLHMNCRSLTTDTSNLIPSSETGTEWPASHFHADGTFDAPQADLPRPMPSGNMGRDWLMNLPLKLLD